MAIKQAWMVKNNLLAAAPSLSVTAKAGESLRIIGLRFGALANGSFIECLIDRVSVGFWALVDINANHVEQWSLGTDHGNVFNRLINKELFAGYPVGEGETFEVRPAVAGTEVVGAIEYEIHDADDMKPDMPGGSRSKEFLFLNYGTNKSIIAINATGAIDMSRNPSEYPAFPFGEVVPAKHEITIYGVLLMHWRDWAGNVNPNYAYLKMIRDRQVLFDEERRGICVREGMGFGTWGPCRQTKADIELFPEPLVFGPGDELIMQMTAGDPEIAVQDIGLALIEKVEIGE